MSTESLKKDHELIEKVVKSMRVTLELLKSGKVIPESILMPVVDFSKNFTGVCHHGKEEESLFPALEKAGMPRHMGPIAVMLMEHEITQKIANKIEESAQDYLRGGSSENLQSYIGQYIEHVEQHLWKENNRLFVMAEMRLQGNSEQVSKSLGETEKRKLQSIGKNRNDYEKLAVDLEQNLTKI